MNESESLGRMHGMLFGLAMLNAASKLRDDIRLRQRQFRLARQQHEQQQRMVQALQAWHESLTRPPAA